MGGFVWKGESQWSCGMVQLLQSVANTHLAGAMTAGQYSSTGGEQQAALVGTYAQCPNWQELV